MSQLVDWLYNHNDPTQKSPFKFKDLLKEGRNKSFPLIIYLNQIQKIFQLPIYHLLKTVCIGFLKPTIASDNAEHPHSLSTLNKSIAEFTYNSIINKTKQKTLHNWGCNNWILYYFDLLFDPSSGKPKKYLIWTWRAYCRISMNKSKISEIHPGT